MRENNVKMLSNFNFLTECGTYLFFPAWFPSFVALLSLTSVCAVANLHVKVKVF